MKFGIIDKSGAWFSYGDERIGQGRENAKKFLVENHELAEEIESKIRDLNGLGNKISEEPVLLEKD